MLGSWGTADPRRLLLSLFFERREDGVEMRGPRRRGSDIGPLISTPAPKMDSTARPLQRAGGNRMCYLGAWGRTAVMLRSDRRKLNLVDRRRQVRGALLIAWSWL
jgi:hypothetical protein